MCVAYDSPLRFHKLRRLLRLQFLSLPFGKRFSASCMSRTRFTFVGTPLRLLFIVVELMRGKLWLATLFFREKVAAASDKQSGPATK